jgi:DNA-binding transcriptional ArsR family regulator
MSNYADAIEPLAYRFKALSNPHRLALFQRLMTCCAPGTKCDVDQAEGFYVGALGDGLNIAPSTLSHHLKALQQCGLIKTERRGKQVFCWVEPAVLQQLSNFFHPR